MTAGDHYRLYPRWKTRGRRHVHLIAQDGSAPLCAARLVESQWDVIATRNAPRLPTCRRCLALAAKQQERNHTNAKVEAKPPGRC